MLRKTLRFARHPWTVTISLLRPVPLLLAALAATGCLSPQSSGQTGGQVGDSSCRESKWVVERGEQTPLGFSAADVLGWIEGTRNGPLVWKAETDQSAAGVITVVPEEGASSIELTIESTGGSIRFVERAAGSGTEDLPGLACSDTLELDVRVQVTTANGALRDVFAGQVVMGTAQHAELTLRFEPSELEGNFVVTSTDPALVPAAFRLVALLSEHDFSGSIEGELQTTSTQVYDNGDLPPEQREDAKDTPTSSVAIVYGRFDSGSE